jgi:hypothetical protein
MSHKNGNGTPLRAALKVFKHRRELVERAAEASARFPPAGGNQEDERFFRVRERTAARRSRDNRGSVVTGEMLTAASSAR